MLRGGNAKLSPESVLTPASVRQEKFGRVKEASVVFDKLTGKARGFGFVEFFNAEDAEKSLGSHQIGGRDATIRHAQKSARC